jgi:hypothetical protein
MRYAARPLASLAALAGWNHDQPGSEVSDLADIQGLKRRRHERPPDEMLRCWFAGYFT